MRPQVVLTEGEGMEDKHSEAEREQKKPRTQGPQTTGKRNTPSKPRNFLEVLMGNRDRAKAENRDIVLATKTEAANQEMAKASRPVRKRILWYETKFLEKTD